MIRVLLVLSVLCLAGCASQKDPSGATFPQIERWWK